MRLLLPVEPDEAIAQKLNANECLEPDAHQLGAWCVDRERGLMFTGFVPAAAYAPGLARALVYHLSAKNEWARALLFRGTGAETDRNLASCAQAICQVAL